MKGAEGRLARRALLAGVLASLALRVGPAYGWGPCGASWTATGALRRGRWFEPPCFALPFPG